eukprot:10260139-Prorocentrum_lima.AAC.1
MLPTNPLDEMILLDEAALASLPTDPILKGLDAFPRGRLAKTAAQEKLKLLKCFHMESKCSLKSCTAL